MKSLRSRISLLTICLLSVVMIAAAVSGVTAIRDIGNRAADRLLLLLCETGEKNLDFYFESVEQSVEMVSAYVESDLDGLETEKLRAHLERARGIFSKLAYQTDGVVTYYYRIDPAVSDTEKGFWYVNLDGEGFQEHEVTDITLYDTDDTSKLVWFTVPKATGKSIWLPPYITDNLDVRVISYNTPIYYNGTFVGVAGIEIDYSTMAEVVDSITLFDSGYAFINDEEGTIIYHPHIDVKELMENHPKIPDGLLSDDTIIQYRFEGVEKKAVWLPLENGMRLNVTVPVSEIDALWKDWIAKLAVIFAILLAGAVLLTALFSGRITKPLRDLTAAAKKVDDGDYDFELQYNGKDEIGVLTNTFRDLTAHLKEYITDLNDLAFADALTSLHNKGAFDKCLQEIETSEKGPGGPLDFAVCIFDCNDLKKVNDRNGHDKGDIYLRESAKIICEVFDHSPVFRIGGDEFAAVLMGSDYRDREELLKRFDEKCLAKRRHETDDWERIDISRGMAVYDPKEDETVNDVVRRADKLMYDHKWRRKHHLDADPEPEIDERTGLKTRAAFRKDFESFVGVQLHVMVLDLDGFRELNDEKGRAFCDGVLSAAGEVLTECYDGCSAYRYGLDEFLVIGKNDPEKNFAQACEKAGRMLKESGTSFSAGYVYGTTKDTQDVRSMIAQAENMLQEAKREGKGRFRGKEYHGSCEMLPDRNTEDSNWRDE